MENVYRLLSKPIRRLLEERGFHKPTEPQVKVIPKVLEGKNVLLIAPTGTGKTEAALLPILDMLIRRHRGEPGIKLLYITPLRALNRDMLDRFLWWCGKLDLKVAVRHGDTGPRERALQAKEPPDILITTPETLQAVLTGRILKRHLRAVRWVVVDEVHELAEDKRGSQLALALERLRWLKMGDFQVVGLSATIGSPEEVAKFLVGANRPVEVVQVSVARTMKFEIVYPAPEPEDYELATRLYTHPEVAARLRFMRSLIEKHRSVLLFTNTRPIAEVLASRFKVWDVDFPVSIHHGSLAKPARVAAETGLKRGELKGLVCTSSLELGIDVGHIDLVIQYMSPRQVTRLVQRVGRSGHRIGRVAKGVVITMDSDDTLEAAVIARKATREELEPVKIPEKPLDVLTHQIVGLLIHKRRWEVEEILELVRQSYPYRDLTKEELVRVLEYMHNRYPRLAWVSFEDEVVLKPARVRKMYEYYFERLSMIPDERQYLVIDEVSNTAVGILDEAFVAEYGEPGTKFICRGSPWKIIGLMGDRIYVKPIDSPTGAIPSWVGEEIPVPFEVAMEVGKIRRRCEELLKKGLSLREVAERLSRTYPAGVETLVRALQEAYEQYKMGVPIPSDRVVTIESWEDFIVINCCFGTLVNRAIARLLGLLLSEKYGTTIGVQHDPYRIILDTGGEFSAKTVYQTLMELAGMDIGDLAVKAAERTGLFKRRLIHVAKRFGALEKRADLTSVSLRSIVESFQGTVVYQEALKETMEKDMDVEGARRVLRAIARGRLKVVVLEGLGELTPISRMGMERIGRKTDIIPPEKMHRLLIESTRARLMNEVKTLVCLENVDFIGPVRVGDMVNGVRCPICGSTRVGVTNQDPEVVKRIFIEKSGKRLTKREARILEGIKESSKVIERYGFAGLLALAGRRLNVKDVLEILSEESKPSDRLIELIMNAEKRALMRRFW
ncbi:MAG: ATP-dependent helicase [Candidatus Bathyarchaeota archaeon B24]|nr:MAG: ATP-dependent helicase [Candidatus Bathyarchaeota archaeon B24]